SSRRNRPLPPRLRTVWHFAMVSYQTCPHKICREEYTGHSQSPGALVSRTFCLPPLTVVSSTGFEDCLKQLYVFRKMFVIVRPLNVTLVTSEKSSRLRLYIAADGNSFEPDEHFLAFLR